MGAPVLDFDVGELAPVLEFDVGWPEDGPEDEPEDGFEESGG